MLLSLVLPNNTESLNRMKCLELELQKVNMKFYYLIITVVSMVKSVEGL